VLLCFLTIAPHHLFSQVNIGGQASAAFISAENGYSQYAYNGGHSTFAWRGDLFADAELSENIFFLSSARMEQDRELYIDLFAVRCTDLFSLPVNIELGQIDIPFGSLGERRYPKNNPFLSLPLAREHRTTLRISDYELWVADARYTVAGNGMRILDRGLYDIGAKLYGSIGIFDYAIAVTNGMLSATSNYSGNGLNGNDGVGKFVRLAVTPLIGLTIGGSYAHGPFLQESNSYYSGYGYAYEYDPAEYTQETFGADIDYSFDHFSFYGEAFFNSWNFEHVYGTSLRATGYSMEGKYTALPRLSFAVRAGGIYFNRISAVTYLPDYSTASYSGTWDHDVTRIELATGYRVSRETLVKMVYQRNIFLKLSDDPHDDVIGVQTVISF
jgi:hypothetical protein